MIEQIEISTGRLGAGESKGGGDREKKRMSCG